MRTFAKGCRESAHSLSGMLSSIPNFVHSWLAVLLLMHLSGILRNSIIVTKRI